MPEIGTPEWAAEAGPRWKLLPPAPGADGAVNLSVTVAPRREATLHWRYENGRVVDGGPGPADPPALALTMVVPDAAEVFSGQVEPSVAFMRGRLKATGSGAVLLAFLRSTTTDGFQEWLKATR
jgi:hypothetical protein